MSDNTEPVEFSLSDIDSKFPKFDSMWKEWIQYIPGIPQHWQARDRAEKLFRKVFKEWELKVKESTREAIRIAYDAGSKVAEEKIAESKFDEGYEHGYWEARKEMKDNLLKSMNLENVPDKWEDDDDQENVI